MLLDERAQRGATSVRFLVFDKEPEGVNGRAAATSVGPVLVVPVRRAQLLTEVGLRIACAFWYVATRAAAELAMADEPPPVVFGTVGSCLAAALPACHNVGLLEVIVGEAWAHRASLEALGLAGETEVITCRIELSSTDGFIGDGIDLQARQGAASSERWLPVVATRLGLSPRDLVVHLHDLGVAAPDDVVDEGTEATLRELLGLESEAEQLERAGVDAPAGTLVDATPGAHTPVAAPARADHIAARMLRKLLADRRVGGRHTRIEHAYGHHFSDEEKDIARRVADWLEKDGIFIPKNNEGSHHISINPRRLRDVGAIIEGRWERMGEIPEAPVL